VGNLGFGLGFRPEQARDVMTSAHVDWYEVVSENFLGVGGRPDRFLTNLRERFPIALHGVGLSIAGTDPLDERYLKALRQLADRCAPAFVSDHLCWTNHRGRNSHDLLPIAYTEEVLAHVAARIATVQERLGRRVYLENPSAYVQFAAGDYDEAEFLATLARRSGCGILLDVNNLFVNQQNLGMDPEAYLAKLRREDLCYMHLAGHTVLEDVRVDTHDDVVPDGVWNVYRMAVARFPDLPSMVEWDGKLPPHAELVREVEKARAYHAAVASSRSGRRHPERSEGSFIRKEILRCAQDDGLSWLVMQDRLWDAITTLEDATPIPPEGLLSEGQPVPAKRGLAVYSDAYFLRILGVLADAFPALANVMGDARFSEAMRAYIAQHPPTEVSIKFTGQHLPAFMTAYDASALGVDARVLADLAAVEWARHDLFDAPDSRAPIGAGVLQELQPNDWEAVRFDVIQAVRLVPVAYDVGAVIDAVAAKAVPDRPVERQGAYLVSRPSEDVHHAWLAPAPAAAFEHLQQGAGFGVVAAAAIAASAAAVDEAAVVHELVGHLAVWLDAGLINGLSVPESSPSASL
jgi:uncharacterized protein (UPF0276 family)